MTKNINPSSSSVLLPLLLLSSLFTQSSAHALNYSYKAIKSGDTVYSILLRNKFSRNQIGTILNQKILPSKYSLIPGEKYGVRKVQGKQTVEVKFMHTLKPMAYIFWKNHSGASGGKLQALKYDKKVFSFKGQVQGSLLQSLLSVLPNEQVAYRFLDAYLLDYDVTKTIQPKAKFSFSVEKLYEGEKFIRFGKILSTSLEIRKKSIIRHLLDIPNTEVSCFVNLKKPVEPKMFFAPVGMLHITSQFRRNRRHPIVKRRRHHMGIDFEQPEGAKVFPASAGKVLRTGYNRAAGNYIVIRHNNRMESYYNHLQKISPQIKSGTRIRVGQTIGKVGCTGYCTKPHLHFALKKAGKFVNPNSYLKNCPYIERKTLKNQLSKLGNQNHSVKR